MYIKVTTNLYNIILIIYLEFYIKLANNHDKEASEEEFSKLIAFLQVECVPRILI